MSDLVNWVEEQIDESELPDEVGIVILAALEGDHELDAYLDSGTSTTRERTLAIAGDDVTPGGTFLSSVKVEGFRGIGAPTELKLEPKPGLTIVAGRNGSGKSSLSEALELALTGDTYRWEQKSSVDWRKHWRNLHHDTARITIGVVEEVSGPITITTSWDDSETAVENRTSKVQRGSGKQQDGVAELGWARALEQFRPILSYDEFGGVFESGRTKLYDALASILGVEQLSDALKRIQARHKSRKAPGAAATQARKDLLARVSDVTEGRAAEAAKLLSKTSPDTAALRALVTGSAPVDSGPLPALRAMTMLSAPTTPEQAATVAQRLRASVAGVADVAAEDSSRTRARLTLLESALRVHADHGDMTCPVCLKGDLDDAWATQSQTFVAKTKKEFSEFDQAQQNLSLALADARKLLVPRPTTLGPAPVPEVEGAVVAARTAWDAWVAGPAGSDATTALALADHLELHLDDVLAALDVVREAAAVQVAALDDVWQPLATAIGGWCDTWDAWIADKDGVDQLAAAEKWLKANDLRLKNERLAPIENGARAAWAKLRQESNVELGSLTLAGSSNQRRVQIDAAVDGVDAGSIAVLSQGELHALALALFLPRVTRSESPFRFLVLDDPVQAMDPAKVDGLLELLTEIAKDHQVIVLSHDDRLAAAVRRSGTGATILEVTRGQESSVEITVSTDPATRWLSDAFGLVKEWETERLTESAMRRTLPGLLRFAAESAAKDAFYSRALKNGAALVEVEETWGRAATTRTKIGLAVFGEERPNSELDQWAAAPYRKFALKTTGPSMHPGLKPELDPLESVRDVERLVKDIVALE